MENDALWRARLEADHDNLRAALDRAEVSGESSVALRLAAALVPFWESEHLGEGRQRMESVLSLYQQRDPNRAKALAGAALLARQSGDASTAKLRAEEALALYRELGDTKGAANAIVFLGLAIADQGEFARGEQLFEEAAGLFASEGDEVNALWANRLLAWMCDELGDRERARSLHEHNLERARALANRQMEGQTLTGLAGLAMDEGQVQDAVRLLRDALRIDRELGSHLQAMLDLSRFARALARAGGADADAAKLLSCAEALRDEVGAAPPYLMSMHTEALEILRSRLSEGDFGVAWEEGRALGVDDAIALALGEPGSGA